MTPSAPKFVAVMTPPIPVQMRSQIDAHLEMPSLDAVVNAEMVDPNQAKVQYGTPDPPSFTITSAASPSPSSRFLFFFLFFALLLFFSSSPFLHLFHYFKLL